MTTQHLETDYLVVGAGAAGMAFADALVSHAKADIIIVDRRHAPGGHWHDAYPFVQLHQPSSFYGVNSLPLGRDTIDHVGLNAGLYERATAPELLSYYDQVMRQVLLPSGRVRHFPLCDYAGDGAFASRLTGHQYHVVVRRAVVDATYLEPSVPSRTTPPFGVDDEVKCVPINALAHTLAPAPRYVIVGAGKTAHDAILWLLQQGLPPERVRWIKPREAWFLNRHFRQGSTLVGQLIEGLARQVEAVAGATTLEDLFARVEASGQLLRVDQQVTPTMWRGPTISEGELTQLRRVTDIVRLGHVRHIEPTSVVLDHGSIEARPDDCYIHCAAGGLNAAPAVPIFAEGRITLQSIRSGLAPFNSALIAYVEATRDHLAEKNRLCPPQHQPNVPLDWLHGTLVGMQADRAWSKEPDIAAWLDRARLNASRGLRLQAGMPEVQRAMARHGQFAAPAVAVLAQLLEGRGR